MSDVMLFAVVATTAVALATLALHALSRRSAPAADLTGLSLTALPGAEQPCGSGEHKPLVDPSVWHSATVTELHEAEELLDWAECAGFEERELLVLNDSTFLVRWRCRTDAEASA
jgi:hypothetical protein